MTAMFSVKLSDNLFLQNIFVDWDVLAGYLVRVTVNNVGYSVSLRDYDSIGYWLRQLITYVENAA
jgi:hypothetical protein